MPSVIRGSDLFDTNTAIGFSTNHNAATGTVNIPSGLEIGTRRLIRKIHPTQGTVTINCTGETFTRAGLASVELNADGDYWLLEKVTATRWELVDGWNTGENANGLWTETADGLQNQWVALTSTRPTGASSWQWYYPKPSVFGAQGLPSVMFISGSSGGMAVRIEGHTNTNSSGFTFNNNGGGVTGTLRFGHKSRWYQ